MTDKRPDPKPKKNPELWQAFCTWRDLVELRKRYTLTIKAIERGKSNLDADYYKTFLHAINADEQIELRRKDMVTFGRRLGAMWTWITSIRGMASENLPAQLLGQIDDIGKFDTISKLWAFSGWAVRDGEIQRFAYGTKAPYNKKLKSAWFLCVDQFVRQNTPVYRDLYDEEKERQRELHPDALCTVCGGVAVKKGQTWQCGECGQKNVNHKLKFTDGHIDARARRKVAKVFAQHVHTVWRQCEGLPVREPWIIAHGGHVDYIPPPNWPPEGGVIKVLDE
jgi:hypothetical protein